MFQGKRILAIIPARGGSKGLPRKNILPLCGLPLIGWPINAARGSKYVDRIIVSTDDAEIAEKATSLGAEIPFLRPPELASDSATSFSVVEHAVNFHRDKGDFFHYILLLEPTSPLTESSDVDKAIELLFQNPNNASSIVGVSEVHSSHPDFDLIIDSDGLIKPYLGKNFSVKRRQEIQKVYFLEGSLYFSEIETYFNKQTFYHDKTLPYIVPKWKSFEIDDFVDWVCVEAILNNINKIKK
ncbi:MAG: acylneuraminate cytidylyltransferase family protein [Candidatus Riflebacteria bacterium]|nr:acylneuraminate cytidylyltransferase family protein [Candidatus Riflebacteria bacterium]